MENVELVRLCPCVLVVVLNSSLPTFSQPFFFVFMVYSRRHFELRCGGGGGGRELQLAICSLETKLGRQLGKLRQKDPFLEKDTNNTRHATFETNIKFEGLKTEIPGIRISLLLILVAGSIKKKSPPPSSVSPMPPPVGQS